MPRTVIDLATLTPAQGFVLDGDVDRDEAGFSVSTAGDINDDGIDDFIVGAPDGDDAALNAGEAYVVYGKTGPRGPIDLGALAASDGFVISGESSQDSLGTSVAHAGDVNNDGIDDLIVGADNNDDGGNNAGKAYVIYGKTGGYAGIDLTVPLGDDGFEIRGDDTRDFLGTSVSSAGDFNGDGVDDVIVGAREAGPAGGTLGLDHPGRAYVIFGADGGIDEVDTSTFIASQGISIFGDDFGDYTGFAVSRAGDFNGDGRDDILVAARDNDESGEAAGKVFVLFGKSTGLADIDLGNLAPADGIAILGAAPFDTLGTSVSALGDVNGDGRDDIVLGAPSNDDGRQDAGTAYVIYGSASPADIELSTLSMAAGFGIFGDDFSDFAATSVAGAGDVNDDGINDILIGARAGNDGGFDAGEAYLVFGKSGTRPNLDLQDFDAADGFVIQGAASGDQLGSSVAGAGDVNGDGVDDIIVGAIEDSGGESGPGKAYVIYGVAAPDIILGTPDDDPDLMGTPGDDTIDGLAGNDSISGLAGFDTLVGGDGNDTLDGGPNPGDQGDIMLGGLGNDVYHVDSALDLPDEGIVFGGAADGVDEIISHTDFYWDFYSAGDVGRIAEDAVDPEGDGTTFVGSVFSSFVVGNSKTNVLFGRGGSDTYIAGDGIDFISLSTLGLTDENAYAGVDGVNTVIVQQRASGPNSYDIVFEFEVGKDKVDVSDYAAVNGLTSGAEVIARAVDDGTGSSYIALGDGLDYVYMVGLEKVDLAAGDFIV